MGIKKPDVAYEHPNKARNTDKSNSSKNSNPPAIPVKEIGAGKSPETMHVRIIAHYPIAGACEFFDQMCAANIDPKTVMLALLKKGIPVFEERCLKNEIDEIEIQNQLKSDFIETTRVLSRRTFETAKKHFDPFDVLSLRALGAKIGDAIFASVAKN